jgi:hypothetical protein
MEAEVSTPLKIVLGGPSPWWGLAGDATSMVLSSSFREGYSATSPAIACGRLGRACRDAGVPRFNVHSLRHRRVPLLHRQGVD